MQTNHSFLKTYLAGLAAIATAGALAGAVVLVRSAIAKGGEQ